MRVDFSSRKRAAILFSVASACSLAGGSPIEKQAVHLANASGYCDSLDEAQFKSLDISKETEFEIDDGSPTFQFEGGKSYFAAFALPEGKNVSRIGVKSATEGTVVRDTEQGFCPSLMFMDKDRVVLNPVKKMSVTISDGVP